MKKFKLLIASALLITATAAPTIAEARDIQNLYFRLPMYQGSTHTPKALKERTGGYTVMNISDIEGGSYALDGYLVNSSGSQRGDYVSATCC